MTLWDRIKAKLEGPEERDPIALLDRAIRDLESAQEDALRALEQADERDRLLLEEGLRTLAKKLREARAKREEIASRVSRVDRLKECAARLHALQTRLAAMPEAERAGAAGRDLRARIAEALREADELRNPA